MAAPGRSTAPPKPWERAGAAGGNNGPSPFAPASNTHNTAAAVASVATTSGGQKEESTRNVPITDGNTGGRPMPPRPWERSNTGYGSGTGYGAGTGYGTGTMTSFNRTGYGGYGGGMYGGNYGSSYGGGSMYGSGYGGSMYGNSYGGLGGGGGLYGNRYGGAYGGMGAMGGMGGYGMGGMGGMGGFGMGGMGPGDPNNPGGEPPPQAPSFWLSMLHGLQGVMHFFGRLSILVDENTQAFHFFITALLQLCDRAGVLYGELARFVLRLLGFRTGSKARARSKAGARALEGPGMQSGQEMTAKNDPEPAWDNVWTNGDSGPPS